MRIGLQVIAGCLMSLLLVGCTASMPTYRLSDETFQAMGRSSIEVIYLDPAETKLFLAPKADSLGKASQQTLSPMYGPIGMAIVGYDPAAVQKVMDAAQVPLQPYQKQIEDLNLAGRLFSNITGCVMGTPALATAKLSRMPQPATTSLTVPTHDIALGSSAQIVVIISGASSGINPDATRVGSSLHMDVYVKPHPGQAIEIDSHEIGAGSPAPAAPAAAQDLDSNLRGLFAADAAGLKSRLDASLSALDAKLTYYFHALPN